MKTEKNVMPTEDLRKMQLIELELLLQVDQICRENHIKYSLAAGTLLGAVRHKGFIPWDDDLDVFMKREEFEKFEKICASQMDSSRYFLQTWKSDPGYRWGYAKIRRIGTEYLRAGQEAIKCVSGVSIDIFILDNMPDNHLISGIYQIMRRVCIKTLWSVVGVTEDKNPVKRFLYRGIRHIPKSVPLGIMEWMAEKSNKRKSSQIYCMSFYRPLPFNAKKKWYEQGFQTSWFENVIEVEFEGFLFFAGKNYMKYLEHTYVNMWKYPPKEERWIHPPKRYSFDVEIDLRGRGVEEYMKKEPLYITEKEWKMGRGK